MTNDPRRFLPDDWYGGGVPANVHLADDVYIDSSYAFARMLSEVDPAVTLGRGCGVYDRATFVVGPGGRVSVGSFSCLNGVYLVCHQEIEIGNHCLFAWGSVVTDCWLDSTRSVADRKSVMESTALNRERWLANAASPRPVTIEDNVWVGFDSVVMPGVKLGRGCLVGCKTVVTEDLPAYSVFVGNPGRIVRYLEPDDTEQARRRALEEHLRA